MTKFAMHKLAITKTDVFHAFWTLGNNLNVCVLFTPTTPHCGAAHIIGPDTFSNSFEEVFAAANKA